MKKIQLLLLALVAMISIDVWAENVYTKMEGSGTLGTMTLSELTTAVANNGSATIALGIISDTSPSYSTTDGINYYFSADANKVKTLEDKNVFTIELVSGSTNTYTLKTQAGAYIASGNNGGTVTTTTSVSSAAKFTLSTETPSDYYSGYASADKVRFTQNGTFLNCQDKSSSSGWRAGKGGYSAYVIWKINITTKEKDPLYDDAVAKIAEGEVVYNNTLSIPRAAGDKLITSASQLSSNCPDSDEGKDMGYMIDGDASTYFHSSWHSGYEAYSPHDFQVSLPGNTYTVFYLKYTNRVAVNDHIKTMEVYGSNDGGSTYSDLLNTVTLPNNASGASGELLFQLSETPYTYYKFVVTETAPTYRTYFHSAEFQLYPGTDEPLYDVDESYSTALRDAIDALQAKIDNEIAIEQSDIDAISTAMSDITSNVKVEYTVNISGVTGAGTYVTVDGENYENGAKFKSSPLTEEDVTPEVVADRKATVTISGTVINVVYTYNYDYTVDAALFSGKVITEIGAEVETGLAPSKEQWYLWKQNRTIETPVYDTGAGNTLYRAATDDIQVDASAEDVKAYLVRLVQSNEYENAYYIQFATGRYVGTTPVSSTTPGNYLIYNATQSTTGWTGHYAINKTTNGSNYTDILDNNSQGGTLAFWSSGIVSSGANNVWAFYPVEIGVPTTKTYTVNIYGDPTGAATVTVEGVEGTYANGAELQAQGLAATQVTPSDVVNYSSAVAINNTDINVTYYLTSVEGLSNNSVYTLTTQRGTLHYNSENENYNATSEEYDAVNGQWAILTSEKGNMYLYNAGADKFVSENGAATTDPQNAIVAHETGNASWPVYFTMGTNFFNIDGAGTLWVDSWTILDEGNQFKVVYAADYNLTDALARINEAENYEAALTVGAAHWATFVAPYEVDLTAAKTGEADIYAYIMHNDTKVKIASTEDGDEYTTTIPALTPVVVYCNDAVDYTYTGLRGGHDTVVTNTTYKIVSNSLTGVLEAKSDIEAEAGKVNYVLQNNSAVGFYKAANSTISLNANRCYLTLTEDVAAKEFIGLEDVPTGITTTTTATTTATGEFNLAGQRVGSDYKGIVIVNGKKVLNK